MIALDIPAALGTQVMNALDADARSVDVRAQSAYFYALAARVGELFEGEGWGGVGEVCCFFFFFFLCFFFWGERKGREGENSRG